MTDILDEESRILEHVLVIDNGELLIDEDTDVFRGRAYTVMGQTKIFHWFIRHSAFELTMWSIPLVVMYILASYVLLRKATV